MKTVFFSVTKDSVGEENIKLYDGAIVTQMNFHNEVETATKYLTQGGVDAEDLEVYDFDTLMQMVNENDFNSRVAILGHLKIS